MNDCGFVRVSDIYRTKRITLRVVYLPNTFRMSSGMLKTSLRLQDSDKLAKKRSTLNLVCPGLRYAYSIVCMNSDRTPAISKYIVILHRCCDLLVAGALSVQTKSKHVSTQGIIISKVQKPSWIRIFQMKGLILEGTRVAMKSRKPL